ncbi:type II toxin-antitoxin system death-on-curing family toxin [Candidatus Saccharibacteria bacterium]|nr:type II toxin-antitoxin system death-on-curing family toxin [Candidatus Saccharibacteria bacterium]
MEKLSKSSQNAERPSPDYILTAFPEICKRLGFDKEPMYDLNDNNIKTIKYYLDIPFNVVFGEEKFKTLTEKASAIFYFATSNQSFPNGNKRTGVILTLLFLIWNNKFLKATPEELYNFSLFIANNHKKADEDLKLVDEFIRKNLVDFNL